MFNRQSILFIVVTAFSFFFINKYFENRHAPSDLVKDTTAIETTKKNQHLPIKLYIDKEEQAGYSYGFHLEDVYYTFKTEKTAPKYLYSQSKKLQKIENSTSALLVYSDKVSPSISIASTLSKTLYKPTLISLEENSMNLSIDSPDDINLKNNQNTHHLLVTNTPNGTYPLGYWTQKEQKFHPIESIPYLSEFLSVASSTFEESKMNEKFYLLENAYMQVVLSSIGGSVAEINLSFDSSDKKINLIHPISYDQKLKKESAINSLFPLHEAWIIKNQNKVLIKPQLGGYTPVLRRSLMNEDDESLFSIDPKYYAFSLLNDQDENNALSHFKVVRFEENLIEFQGEINGKKLTKTYSLPNNSNKLPYCLECSIDLDDAHQNLWLTSGVLEVELLSNQYKPEMQALTNQSGKNKTEKIKLPKENKSIYHPIESKWVSNSNGFLTSILSQTDKTLFSGVKTYYINDSDALSRYSINTDDEKNYPGYMSSIALENQNNHFIYYAGPMDSKLLGSIDKNFELDKIVSTELNEASSSGGFMQKMIRPFSKFLLFLLNSIYSLVHSWGFSIILLTLLIRLMLYPLNSWSMKSMARVQELAPQLKIIQEKYKKDPNKSRMETALLYRNNDCNPIAGCLGIPLQMPFLFGMFDLLRTSVQIRGISFIPGWIDNLAAPDVLFSWSTPLFFFGTSFHLLPFVNGLLMFAQQKVTNMKQQVTNPSEQQKQMKNMGTIFAIVLPFLFYSMPSGLNIYYIFSTLFGVLQQWYITKKLTKKKVRRKT